MIRAGSRDWRRAHLHAVALIAILFFVIPAALSQQVPMADELPAWLADAMARESGPFEPRTFELAERNFSAELSGASLSAAQKSSRGWYVSADIDAVTSMECWVFTSPVDMAATLGNIVELNLSASAKISGDIVDRATWFVDAGVIGSAPFMAQETLYAMQAGDEQRTGFAKVRIARVDDIHIACSHNQIGFRETFSANFAALVRSASFDRQPVQPFYREVYRQSLDGLGVGIIDRSMAIDADGDLAITTVDSMLLPDPASVATATDTFNYSFFRNGFELINLRAIGSVNGAVSYNLNFQPAGENIYRVVGTAGEQEFDFAIEDDEGPTSIAERMLDIQAMLADPDRNSVTFRTWAPEAQLGALTETTIAFSDGGKESLVATVTNGDRNTQVQLDEYGSYVRTGFAVESGEYAVERILDEGKASRISRSW